jgi:hypothetical protein
VQYNAGFVALQQFLSTFFISPYFLQKQIVNSIVTAEAGTRRQRARRVHCKNQPKT